MKPYEILEHTADVGIRVRAGTLQNLFENAAFGMTDLITESDALKAGPLAKTKHYKLNADSMADLLLKWLREILYTFSTERIVLIKYEFRKLDEKNLDAVAEGVVFDPARHEQKYEVKAVTYHGFKLDKTAEGWQAEIIFDI